jgi:hypothetical protein
LTQKKQNKSGPCNFQQEIMAKFEDKTTDFRCKKVNLMFASCDKKSGSREKHKVLNDSFPRTLLSICPTSLLLGNKCWIIIKSFFLGHCGDSNRQLLYLI